MDKREEAVVVAGRIDVSAVQGVMYFMRWVEFGMGIAWHPDDPAKDIVNADGERLFTDAEAELMDAKWDKCFATCSLTLEDIYALALRVAQERVERHINVPRVTDAGLIEYTFTCVKCGEEFDGDQVWLDSLGDDEPIMCGVCQP